MEMPDGLDVIIVDDDPAVCEMLSEVIKRFYAWGQVRAFSGAKAATDYCRSCEYGVAIFVVDVYLDDQTGFHFLDSIQRKFPMAHEDTVMITGKASDDVVDMCVASDITHLLEKPVKAYALQLSVRAIVTKYIRFAKRILEDPALAQLVSNF
jgi:response regulator of citrate/malate metabolism